MKDFESIIAKCRKLAALADPNNGGAPGEIAAAQEKLRALMLAHNLTPADFDPAHRESFSLLCVSRTPGAKPVKERKLVNLAIHCLAMVLDSWSVSLPFRLVDYYEEQKGNKPPKLRRVYSVQATLTEAEFLEWRECFEHYVDAFLSTMAALRKQARAAAAAVKKGHAGFIIKHSIFPSSPRPGDDVTKPLSEDEAASIYAAMEAAHGTTWERKAAYLAPSHLLA